MHHECNIIQFFWLIWYISQSDVRPWRRGSGTAPGSWLWPRVERGRGSGGGLEAPFGPWAGRGGFGRRGGHIACANRRVPCPLFSQPTCRGWESYRVCDGPRFPNTGLLILRSAGQFKPLRTFLFEEQKQYILFILFIYRISILLLLTELQSSAQ